MNAEQNTADRILDVAQDLIQRRGYNAISFNDIAEGVGIKKPSIVHHFPNKSAIGKAVVIRYRETFFQLIKQCEQDPDKNEQELLELFVSPYLDFGKTDDKICLCGALAGEFLALTEEIQVEVTDFFNQSIATLERILKNGKKSHLFAYKGSAGVLAQSIMDMLQGSLIIKRATGKKKHVEDAIASIKSILFL